MKYQVMRDLTDAEYAELRQSIMANGILSAIDYDEHGNILDGHHRVKICDELGITDIPRMVHAGMTEEEKLRFAREVNTARRQLTAEEKRAETVKRLLKEPELSDRQIAQQVGVSHPFVANIRNEMEQSGEVVTVTTSIGADGKEYPREARRLITLYNPSVQDEKAIQDPDVLCKLVNGIAETIADARRETRREEVIARLESVEAQEAKEIQGVYDVIVLDPPWPMQKIERDVTPEQVEFDYPTMTEDELKQLRIPAADDCHVWLWTTHKFIRMAFGLLEAWGLKYVCSFVWHKPGGFQPYGLPQYNCEFALYARKGTPTFIDTKAFPVCFEAPRSGHSTKPDAFYSLIQRVTAGRRIDMFGRRKIEGFDSWGQEAAS